MGRRVFSRFLFAGGEWKLGGFTGAGAPRLQTRPGARPAPKHSHRSVRRFFVVWVIVAQPQLAPWHSALSAPAGTRDFGMMVTDAVLGNRIGFRRLGDAVAQSQRQRNGGLSAFLEQEEAAGGWLPIAAGGP